MNGLHLFPAAINIGKNALFLNLGDDHKEKIKIEMLKSYYYYGRLSNAQTIYNQINVSYQDKLIEEGVNPHVIFALNGNANYVDLAITSLHEELDRLDINTNQFNYQEYILRRNLGRLYRSKGMHFEEIDQLKKLINYVEKYDFKENKVHVNSKIKLYLRLADLYSENQEEALKVLNHLRKLYENYTIASGQIWVSVYETLGLTYFQLKSYSRARQYFKSTLKFMRDHSKTYTDQNFVHILYQIGKSYAIENKDIKAFTEFRKAYHILQEMPEDQRNPKNELNLYIDMAWALCYLDRAVEMEDMVKKAYHSFMTYYKKYKGNNSFQSLFIDTRSNITDLLTELYGTTLEELKKNKEMLDISQSLAKLDLSA